MVSIKKVTIVCAFAAALILLGGPLMKDAGAGPVWRFGPDDQALLKLEYKGQFQVMVRDTGSEADGEGTTKEFNFRRNRFALIGAYGKNFGIYVNTEFQEDNNIHPLTVDDGDNSDFTIIDAQIRYKYDDAFQIRMGKYKYNFTRENLDACEEPLTLDRSLFIRAPYVATRDKGVAFWGNLLNQKVQYRAGVTNGRSDSVSSPESNFRYSARAHVSLLDPEKGYGYRGTYLGKKKVLTVGGAYQMENDIAYDNTLTETGSKDYKAWTADLFFEYPVENIGILTLSSAYVDYDLDDCVKGANPDAGAIDLTGEKNGSYTKAAYMLPDMPLQFFGRYETWSFARLNGIYDQEIVWYGGGINYYFRGQNLKFTLEYSKNDFDVEDANNEDFQTYVAQLQVWF